MSITVLDDVVENIGFKSWRAQSAIRAERWAGMLRELCIVRGLGFENVTLCAHGFGSQEECGM
jgi:hypothetical protein